MKEYISRSEGDQTAFSPSMLNAVPSVLRSFFALFVVMTVMCAFGCVSVCMRVCVGVGGCTYYS